MANLLNFGGWKIISRENKFQTFISRSIGYVNFNPVVSSAVGGELCTEPPTTPGLFFFETES